MKRIVCLLVSVVLMMSACAGALAETGYESLKEELSATYGEGNSQELEVAKHVLAMFSLGSAEENAYIVLYGTNADDQGEGTIWYVESYQALVQLALFCDTWEDKAALVSEGYQLIYVLNLGEDETGESRYGTISSAEEAEMMFEVISGIFGMQAE